MKTAPRLTRRSLLKTLGGGLLIAAIVPSEIASAFAQRGAPPPQNIGAWIHIAPDGSITVYTGKAEVGQNARTSISQAAAEELRVPVDRVRVVMADTDMVPFDMGTFGSQTTPRMIPIIRRAAASARKALIETAAKRWSVDPSALTAANGQIGGAGKTAGYGEIAKVQTGDPNMDADLALTPATEWKVLGTGVKKIDGRDFVTGKHAYASDATVPGMLHGKVLRAPKFGATLTSIDTTAAEAMLGVKVVHEENFVAVAAPTVRLANRALAAIKATWTDPQTTISSKNIHEALRGTTNLEGPPNHWPDETKVIRHTFTCPYIAHVPLEPRAALAEWDGNKLTVHTGTQRPFGVKGDLVQELSLQPSQVRVIVPDTGSGYGGKHAGDAAIEAARIAKAIKAPVKMVWTREEEFSFAYFRPAGVVEAAAALDRDSLLAGWTFDNFNSGPSALKSPYEVQNRRENYHEADSPLRQGSYRGLAGTFNHFARETLMDELAAQAKLDPVEFRLRNLKDERLIAVLKAAAEKLGWPGKASGGHGFGIACGTEKGSYIATAAEVVVDPDTKDIKVLRAVSAFECGAILNPDHLHNQVAGALVMGLGGALFEAIEFADSKIQTNTLYRYRVPRHMDVPAIEVILLDRKDIPSAGAGETPIMTVAPAVRNAIFNATGIRLRNMPLKLGA